MFPCFPDSLLKMMSVWIASSAVVAGAYVAFKGIYNCNICKAVIIICQASGFKQHTWYAYTCCMVHLLPGRLYWISVALIISNYFMSTCATLSGIFNRSHKWATQLSIVWSKSDPMTHDQPSYRMWSPNLNIIVGLHEVLHVYVKGFVHEVCWKRVRTAKDSPTLVIFKQHV